MHIKCPKCSFTRDVPDDKIPESSRRATCPKCGTRFDFREQSSSDQADQADVHNPQAAGEKETTRDNIWTQLDNMGGSEESGNESSAAPHPQNSEDKKTPWENLDEEGFFPGFARTIKKAMFSPVDFFSGMPLTGLGRPLVFYLILAEIQAVATFIWQMLGFVPMMGQHGQGAGLVGLGVMGIGSLALLIIYPVILTLLLFVVSGINHLLLKICGAGDQGFEGTFRVVAYGNSPMILGVIPFVGAFIGSIWTIVVTVIGYKNMHAATYGRVILALLLPVIVGIALVFLAMLF
ncbi:MAG: YIP1 family protein [Thermodesulfobacteriota bacterium]